MSIHAKVFGALRQRIKEMISHMYLCWRKPCICVDESQVFGMMKALHLGWWKPGFGASETLFFHFSFCLAKMSIPCNSLNWRKIFSIVLWFWEFPIFCYLLTLKTHTFTLFTLNIVNGGGWKAVPLSFI